MKIKIEIFFVIVIIICIFSLEWLTNSISEKSVNEISEEAIEVIENLEKVSKLKEENKLKDDLKDELEVKVENLKGKWLYEEEKLSVFAEHDELEKVTRSLVVLEENSKNEEYESALEDAAEFMYWLNHFKDKDKLELKNIF